MDIARRRDHCASGTQSQRRRPRTYSRLADQFASRKHRQPPSGKLADITVSDSCADMPHREEDRKRSPSRDVDMGDIHLPEIR
jgi:hypothetical protein